MRTRAIGLALDERGTAAGTGTLHGFAGSLGHRGHIVTVHFDAGNAITYAATRDAWIARRILKWNLGCELVVLADEQHREPPDACHVQPFVERAVVHRAIAEERNGHTVGLQELEAVARARRLKNARADD